MKRKATRILTCAVCGTQKEIPDNYRFKNRRFCSIECRHRGQCITSTERSSTIQCLSCGKDIVVKPFQRAFRKYCSVPCALKVNGTPLPPRNFKSGRRIGGEGYVELLVAPSTYRPEHVVVAEKALGKPLPEKACVHHVDRNPSNNAPNNLVICENWRYHTLLHARMRIIDVGGNPDIEKHCRQCKTLKPKTEFARSAANWDGYLNICRPCRYEYSKALRSKLRRACEAKGRA